jgi:D-cysteine desulfhydrase
MKAEAAPAADPRSRAADAPGAARAGASGALAAVEPALFRRHPALRALPRAPFVLAPTPVEPLALPGVAPGTCFVKRDDRSCPLYGGNKPRKLEFVLGAAAARGTRRLVTSGGIGTHHGLATAILGRSLGMATTVVCVPQPLTKHVLEQLEAMLAFGTELIFARTVPGAAARTIQSLLRSAVAGERPELVPTGGSSAVGDIGFVSAAFELAEQIEAGLVPEPREIYLPIGSGGSLSGLALGVRLAGLRARIIGVLVTDILPPGPRRIAALARGTLARLRRLDPTLPAVSIGPADFEITRAQLGPAYGADTDAGRTAARLAGAAGLTLEQTYTAKCFAELLARTADGRAETPLLFWNTYNSVDFWAHAPARPGLDGLPAPLRAWIAAHD